MNRTCVLCVLTAVSCVFLLFQLYTHRQSAAQNGDVVSGRGHLSGKEAQRHLVKTFLMLVHKFSLPVFLVDTESLRLLSQDALLYRAGQQHETHCSFLCTHRDFTTFGLMGNLWNYNAALLQAAEERGVEVLEVRGKDPRLAGVEDLAGKEIPLHLLFRFNQRLVHVVVLYERSGMFLWHGPLRPSAAVDRTFAPFSKLDFGRHPGAYDRPQLIFTVLDGLDVRLPKNLSGFLQQHSHSRFLECRSREARAFYQLNPDDTSPEAVDFRMRARSLLQLASRVLNELGVPFWISSGTCLACLSLFFSPCVELFLFLFCLPQHTHFLSLFFPHLILFLSGWFRQCSIISYSKDVDLGVWIKDYRPDIVPAFQRAGLPLKHKFGKVEDSLELSFQGTGVKLDIFFFYEEQQLVWNGGTQAKSGRKFKYVFPHFSLCWAELLELRVRVPCETLDYVSANYGSDWNVPVKTWDWKSSPPNVKENGVWPVDEWDDVIQVY